MPGEFSVHVDPDELAAQSVAAAFQTTEGKHGGKAGRSGKGAAPSASRGKAERGGQSSAQPRRYAFRRS
ncbi:hypothetical protein GCM10022251_65840 [Phytohabitans flavus]|uniref:Uncharacterized protein n=1 Tax=Phytohabitans flavus TaxID=1076124 RepID=A0A6F8XIH5_9ACTN|nr:hypothetical protein [Phytohabitans flavus]BCB73603.1 hypothetical protein Pflav_000130 [Phytohabitans flavus]